MKIAVIYHSETGNTARIAERIAEGARTIPGTEARLMGLDGIDEAFLAEARAMVIGCPVYAGGLSWQMKRWLDTTKLKLAGKLGSVFATENHVGGGADIAELSMAAGLLVRGCLVYAAGASLGAPFTHFGAVAVKDGDEAQKERARVLGSRVAEKARELWGGAEPMKSL